MGEVVRGFYGVVDVAAGPGAVELARWLAGELVKGGASILQVRVKKGGSGALLEIARAVRAVVAGIPLVVNDRPDIALAVGAEGVHLGQDDLPLPAARNIAPGLLIGVSTHTLAQARAAAEGGADYLGFGPIYPTGTKDNPDPVVGVGQLARVVAAVAPVPVVAIGGITPARAREVADTGAAAACVISAVNRAADVVAAARQVAAAFA
ncbi:MAG TPA: thiamine phosphate synthase [Haliangiales bacterium]|nr:thiamine phosphate synthase [Haliangiales bacterium]